MKKFITTVILLALVSVTVFFVGWISFLQDSDSVLVVFSKTGGWKTDAVMPGEFVWMWERLIPTNVKVFRFSVIPLTVEETIPSVLPSGTLYAAMIDSAEVFSYDTKLLVAYTVSREALPALARDEGLRPDTLNDWLLERSRAIAQAAVRFAVKPAIPGESEPLVRESIRHTLKTKIEDEVPGIDIEAVDASILRIPDMDLYERAKKMYFSMLDSKEKSLSQAIRDIADDSVKTDRTLEKLEALGAVLTKYPILLNYFAVNNGKDPGIINLETLPGGKAVNDGPVK